MTDRQRKRRTFPDGAAVLGLDLIFLVSFVPEISHDEKNSDRVADADKKFLITLPEKQVVHVVINLQQIRN